MFKDTSYSQKLNQAGSWGCLDFVTDISIPGTQQLVSKTFQDKTDKAKN